MFNKSVNFSFSVKLTMKLGFQKFSLLSSITGVCYSEVVISTKGGKLVHINPVQRPKVPTAYLDSAVIATRTNIAPVIDKIVRSESEAKLEESKNVEPKSTETWHGSCESAPEYSGGTLDCEASSCSFECDAGGMIPSIIPTFVKCELNEEGVGGTWTYQIPEPDFPCGHIVAENLFFAKPTLPSESTTPPATTQDITTVNFEGKDDFEYDYSQNFTENPLETLNVDDEKEKGPENSNQPKILCQETDLPINIENFDSWVCTKTACSLICLKNNITTTVRKATTCDLTSGTWQSGTRNIENLSCDKDSSLLNNYGECDGQLLPEIPDAKWVCKKGRCSYQCDFKWDHKRYTKAVKCEINLETGKHSWVSDRVPLAEVHCSYNRRYLPTCKLEDQPIVDDGLWKCDKKFKKCKLECFNGWNARASIVCEDDMWKSKGGAGDEGESLARKGAYSCKTHNLRVCNEEYSALERNV